jgi:hypothetical protein
MTVALWKALSAPIGLRLLKIEEKAQDNGMTEEMKIEHAALQERWSELLGQLMRGLSK